MPFGVASAGRGAWPAKRRITKRIATNATSISNANIRNSANSAPRPRWLINAARPRPAARPATGPSHERRGAAAAPAAAFVGAGVAWVGAAGLAGTASGVRAGSVRFMPEKPPPRRRASASSGSRVSEHRATDRATNQRVIEAFPFNGAGGEAAR